MLLTFAITLFLSAALIFWLEPMVAKMVLPLLGGAPAVWNTCMVFFQAVLLAGYAYAHWSAKHLRLRHQALLHATLLTVSALCLPVRIPDLALSALSGGPSPALWLLGALTLMIGLPFFTICATAPLLQKWFSETGAAGAKDPYFLYSASNAGSLVALLGYPVLLEPTLRLAGQSLFWAVLYVALAAMTVVCGLRAVRCSAAHSTGGVVYSSQADPTGQGPGADRLSWRQRLYWTALAFVPSSLCLGVTTYLSTDVAAVPLLWVIPLALYLTTFILAFARRQLVPQALADRAAPIGALVLIFVLLTKATQPVVLLMLMHLAFLFVAGLFCHQRLAADRPSPAHLTEFYLWVSVGGVLGGLFNAIVAPSVFNSVAEYPLVIVMLCLLKAFDTSEEQGLRMRWHDLGLPLGVGVITACLALAVPKAGGFPIQLSNALVFGIPTVLAYLLKRRPLRYALALSAIILGGLCKPDLHGRTLHVERNFFGVSRVTLDPTGSFRRLVHGNTIHGRQYTEPARQCEPLAYYHRMGPVSWVFEARHQRPASPRVAVVGLGAGALVCYAKPQEQWTYYEIDPAVARIARNTNYFTYLTRCSAAPVEVILGDARLRLREAPARHYGLIILDAFSSDAIPVHLLTREALDLYSSKLATGGLLALHISNRCLDLQPVLGDLAADAGLSCIACDDSVDYRSPLEPGMESSHWVVVARKQADLEFFRKNVRWQAVLRRSRAVVWTDDFSNLLGAFKWN